MTYPKNIFTPQEWVAYTKQQVPYMVSVVCPVYNQLSCIRQCLDGVLMQKTSFDFELVVHDDASTDGTTDVLREYAEIYPDKVRLVLQAANQYSKKHVLVGHQLLWSNVKGKYISFCEGDDYWIDALKLQKQVDFLETHPDYTMCFHNVEVISNVASEIMRFSHLEERDYTAKEIYEKWSIPTCSAVYRNFLPASVFTDTHIYIADIFIYLNLALRGKIFCMNQNMGAYRRHDAGLSFGIDAQRAILLAHQYLFMAKYFKDNPDLVQISNAKALGYCSTLMYALPDVTKKQKLALLPAFQALRGNRLLSFSTLSFIYTYIVKKRK